MVDNINLNKISPLLSSTERVKSVDRRQRNDQQPPFKGALQDKQKRKKKKKKGRDGTLSESTSVKDRPHPSARAAERHQKKETESPPDQSKKIIDIRV
ncbi:MAG: hypothetical protein WBM69_24215 [Desulfobacterales bacterium]